jgi:hypothetical protein
MTTIYNVHIYREMRLVFGGIQAESLEAAASIARDKPTSDADEIDDCEGETLSAVVDVVGDEEYEQSRFIDFENEQLRRAAPALLAKLLAVAELRRRWRSQDEAETIDSIEYMDGLNALELDTAIAQAGPAVSDTPDPANKSYSVLLFYPNYANDTGTETYYAFVEAPDAIEAIAMAQRQAFAAQAGAIFPPDDFAPLLVTEGHHYGQPLFNK